MTRTDKHAAQLTRRALILTLAACCSTLAAANPSGPTVINGSASFVTSGNTLNVTNSSGAIINWQQFGIGANETTRFNQPSAQSTVLNRVTGGDPTQILGTLQSNGQVFLINPWGVLFGRNAVIDVNKLVASSLNLSDANFIARNFSFNGGGFGGVVNQGRITTPLGGSVWLIGSEVRNEGLITSPQGQVMLAAGTSVELVDTAGPELSVTIKADGNRAVNLGQVNAAGGRIDMYGALIDQQGVLSADSASVDEKGHIKLLAGDTLKVDGTLTARGIEGDGGFIETSGAHVQVADSAKIDTSSAKGKTGTWLIDPNDYTIAASGGDITGSALGSQLNNNNVVIDTATMGHAGSGDIAVNDAIHWGGNGTANSLTLKAQRDLTVSAAITNLGPDPANPARPSPVYAKGSLTLVAQRNLLVNPWQMVLAGTGGLNLVAGWDGVSALSSPVTQPSVGNLTLDRSMAAAYGGAVKLAAGNNLVIHSDWQSANQSSTGAVWGVVSGTGNTIKVDVGNDITLDSIGSFAGVNGYAFGIIANTTDPSASTMVINAGGSINLLAAGAADNNGVMIYNSAGGQTISAKQINLVAGTKGSNNFAQIVARGNQNITLTGSGNVLTMTAGGSSANNANDFAVISQNSSTAGSQRISFTGDNANVVLTGGKGSGMNGQAFPGCTTCGGKSSGNIAIIVNSYGDQTLDFQRGGSLSLYAGSAGNVNSATIFDMATTGTQSIGSSGGSANYPAITLYGGTSGGDWAASPILGGNYLANAAAIISSASQQTVQATNLTMKGVNPTGAKGAVNAGAGIGQSNNSGSQSITATGDITLTGGDGLTSYPVNSSAAIYAYGSGGQSITAQSMNLAGGAAGNYNRAEVLATNGPQNITLTGSGATVLSIAGGGGNGDSGDQAGILHQNFDLSVVPGNQTIALTGSGAGIKLQGGSGSGTGDQGANCLLAGGDAALCANSENQAHIYNQGATQSIAFNQGNGSILIIGGAIGKNNTASIDGHGALTINGNPDITVRSGASGGAAIFVPKPTLQGTQPGFGNDAGILADGVATINARNVSVDASTAAAGTVSRAYLAGGTGLTLNATGNVALRGGASAPVNVINNATHPYQDKAATTALLGTLGVGKTTLKVDGDLTMTGGTGSAGQALIGAAMGTGDVAIKVGGNVTLTGNSGGVYLGTSPLASATPVSNTITTLLAGNTVTFNSPIYSDVNYGSGNLLVVASPKFVNNAGAALFDKVASGNRWLVYSHDPAGNSLGGLSSGNPDIYNASYTANPPATVAAGHRLLYEIPEPVATDPCAINPAACQVTTADSATSRNSQQQVVGSTAESGATQPPLKIDTKLTSDTAQTSSGVAQIAVVASVKNEDKPVTAVDKAIKADEQKSGTELKQEAAKAKEESAQSAKEAQKAEAEAKKAETEAKKQKSAEGREAASAEMEARKAEATAHKAGAEAKAAEAEAKQAALEAKTAATDEQRSAAQAKQVAAQTRKVTAEAKQAVAETKQSEAESKKATVEVKLAESAAKKAKSPEQRAIATQKVAEKKTEAEIKKIEVDVKATEADARQAAADSQTLKAPGARLVAEKRSEAKQAEAEMKAANVEARRADNAASKAEAAAKQAKTPEQRASAEKRAQEQKQQAVAKREEAKVKQAEAERKADEHRVAEQKRAEERKGEVAKAFAAAAIGKMNMAAMSATIAARHELKTEIFKLALNILERDPNAAALPPCGAGSDVCAPTKMAHEASVAARLAIPKPVSAALPQIQRKVALLVGINDYASPVIPKLETAVGDTEAVGKVMQDKLGYEVRYVKNGSQAEIVRAINKLGREVGPQDSVAIYYAGHGYLNEDTKTGYWIPADASITSPAQWIANTDITKMLGAIPAKQIMLVSDSCYSGALTREQKIDAKSISSDPALVLAKRSVTVMSSGSEEPVSDEGRDGRSIFAWHLMEGLKNVDRYTPALQLYEGVRTQVTAEFPQTPQYGASPAAGHSVGGEYLVETRTYK